MTKNYSQLLRDQRWQKKRLEIMQRDEFTCTRCYESEKTLNVHHCYYLYGKKPWDYENELKAISASSNVA
jgi:5-methylcytosine-specific restriction endonuclease McrA